MSILDIGLRIRNKKAKDVSKHAYLEKMLTDLLITEFLEGQWIGRITQEWFDILKKCISDAEKIAKKQKTKGD